MATIRIINNGNTHLVYNNEGDTEVDLGKMTKEGDNVMLTQDGNIDIYFGKDSIVTLSWKEYRRIVTSNITPASY
jgi:hypothetical protein